MPGGHLQGLNILQPEITQNWYPKMYFIRCMMYGATVYPHEKKEAKIDYFADCFLFLSFVEETLCGNAIPGE